MRTRPPKASAPRSLVGTSRDHRDVGASWNRVRKQFVDHLREVVQDAGSQNSLADALGVPRSTVSAWFAAKRVRLPTPEQLWRISHLFDVSMDWLLGFSVPKRRSEREKVGVVWEELRSEVLKALRPRIPHIHAQTLEAVVGGPDKFWNELVDHVADAAERTEGERLRIEENAIRAGLALVRKVAMGKGHLDRNLAASLLEMGRDTQCSC